MLFAPFLISFGAVAVGTEGDTRLVTYTFEHGLRWLLGVPEHSSIWSSPIFFPTSGVLTYTDVGLGFAAPYWAFRLAGLTTTTSMQLWLITWSIVDYVVLYYLLRRAVKLCPLGAAVAAYISVFSPYKAGQLIHP